MIDLSHFGRKGPLDSALVMSAVAHQVGVLEYVLFTAAYGHFSTFRVFSLCFLLVLFLETGALFSKL